MLIKLLRRDHCSKVRLSQAEQGYLFILPCLLMLLLVLGFPATVAVLNSFAPLWSKGSSWNFTLENYERLTRDPIFWNSLGKTFYFVGGTVALHLLIGLAVAMALNAEIRARRFLRAVTILPWTVPDVISGLIWSFMYNPLSGIINDVLMKMGLIRSPIEWLADPQLAMPSIIFSDVWRGYPFVMLILLAGLQAIPKEQYEAARVDGASPLQEFWHITLPNLKQMIVIAVALDIIWQTRRFGLVYVMTQGGPGHATEILSILVYKQYFKYFNFEYASAMAVVMAIFLLLVSLPYIRIIVRR
ncbi:TPA: sugar ABC transporter permease, partial [Candidatus Bipolaricaulota bacterium]|nr:sugar ABC transporter permease [Candidatus Bipolaricaulota bacterium]